MYVLADKIALYNVRDVYRNKTILMRPINRTFKRFLSRLIHFRGSARESSASITPTFAKEETLSLIYHSSVCSPARSLASRSNKGINRLLTVGPYKRRSRVQRRAMR